MDLYGWIDYMSRTLIFQPKIEQDKKYKGTSATVSYLLPNDNRP